MLINVNVAEKKKLYNVVKLNDVPWNIGQLTCIFLVYTQAFYLERVLYNYFYNAVENRLATTINATYAWHMMDFKFGCNTVEHTAWQLSYILTVFF